MRVRPGCLACVLSDLEGALQNEGVPEAKQAAILARAAGLLGTGFEERRVPSHYITEAHRLMKQETSNPFPFKTTRELANTFSLSLQPGLQEEAAAQPSERARFDLLVAWAVAANAFDFRTVAAGYGLDEAAFRRHLDHFLSSGLSVDHRPAIYELARRARHVLYIHDNVGEIVFDKMLIGLLKGRSHVVSVLRGGPITSDATIQDGREIGLEEVAEVIVGCPDTLGLSWEERTQAFREALARADLVIAKGQANFYVMEEHRSEIGKPIACLLTTKCGYVSGYFGAEDLIGVAALLQPAP